MLQQLNVYIYVLLALVCSLESTDKDTRKAFCVRRRVCASDVYANDPRLAFTEPDNEERRKQEAQFTADCEHSVRTGELLIFETEMFNLIKFDMLRSIWFFYVSKRA